MLLMASTRSPHPERERSEQSKDAFSPIRNLENRLGATGGVDLRLSIAEGAEDPVVRADAAGFLEEMRADVLPHELLVGRYLEEAAVAALGDQGVCVGEPLRRGNVWAVVLEHRRVGVPSPECA